MTGKVQKISEGGDPISLLTPMQRRWLEVYLQTWNASEAARQAGYVLPEKAAHQIKNNPVIKAAVEARVSEGAMKSDEVLARLAQQARANIADFFILEPDSVTGTVSPVWDWDKIKEFGYLVKSVKATKYGYDVEFYDSQKALELIGRNLALFTDNVNLEAKTVAKAYVTVSPDDWDEPAPEEKQGQ